MSGQSRLGTFFAGRLPTTRLYACAECRVSPDPAKSRLGLGNQDPCDSEPACQPARCAPEASYDQRAEAGCMLCTPISPPLTPSPTADSLSSTPRLVCPSAVNCHPCTIHYALAHTRLSFTLPLSHSFIPRPPPRLTPENSQDRQAPRDVPGIFPKPPALHPTLPLSSNPTTAPTHPTRTSSSTPSRSSNRLIPHHHITSV